MFLNTVIFLCMSLLHFALTESDPCMFENCRIRFTVHSTTDRHFSVRFFGKHLMSTPIGFVQQDTNGYYYALEGCQEEWKMSIFDEKGEFQASVPLGSPSNGIVTVTVGENNKKQLAALEIQNAQCTEVVPKDDPLPVLHFLKPGENVDITDDEDSNVNLKKEIADKKTAGDFRSRTENDFVVGKGELKGQKQGPIDETVIEAEQLRSTSTSTPEKTVEKSGHSSNISDSDFEKLLHDESVINMCNIVCSHI